MKEIKKINHKQIEKVVIADDNPTDFFTDCRKHLALVKSAATLLSRDIKSHLNNNLQPQELSPLVDLSLKNDMVISTLRYQYSDNLNINQMDLINDIIEKTKSNYSTFKLTVDIEYIFGNCQNNQNNITIELAINRRLTINESSFTTIDN